MWTSFSYEAKQVASFSLCSDWFYVSNAEQGQALQIENTNFLDKTFIAMHFQ